MTVELHDVVLADPALARLDPGARRLALRALVAERVEVDRVPETVRRLSDAIDGFGPLTALMEERDVTDVLVNGPGEVWAERNGSLRREPIAFDTEEGLLLLVERLLSAAGERADMEHPIADARLPDGSRLHVVMPPIAPRGPLVSIRRFPVSGWTLEELVTRASVTTDQAALLTAAVVERRTILIAGGTGTGKTSLLGALLRIVPPIERVVVLEETPELAPACDHFVSLVCRRANEAGVGDVDLSVLLRAALRMRPDRIIVGEVRGPEAEVALAAMSTGHPGSLLTIHASSARGALERLALLANAGGRGTPHEILGSSVDAAIDLVVQLERAGNRRRVAEIIER